MASTHTASDPAKLLLRLPRSLHEQLKTTAEAQGVSVNTLLATLLAGSIGFELAHDKKKPRRPRQRSRGTTTSEATDAARQTV